MIGSDSNKPQLALPMKVAIARQVNELDMGVLEDGTPYLTGRSLARLCGAAPSTISEPAAKWLAGNRDSKLARFLLSLGIDGPSLYIPTDLNGALVHAYPDEVCMAMLEYFAFVSDRVNGTAQDNFRKLARAGLRIFIYRQVGYDPKSRIPPELRDFLDRLRMNSAPPGYFSVHRELADLVFFSIQRGLIVDDRTIPDISVGSYWSRKWDKDGLDARFGQRMRWAHVYPESHRQSKAGPIEAWVYPLEALGEFRIWMQNEYLPLLFPKYLQTKVAQKLLPTSAAELILTALEEHAGLLPSAPTP